MEIKDYRSQIEAIKAKLYREEISYDQAKELAKPIIAEMNIRSAEIAKKYDQRPHKFSFAGLIR